jgi:hypothetical protein
MKYWERIESNPAETVFDIETDGDIYKQITIEAWHTGDGCEEGKAIAKVILTAHGDICVVYIDNTAKTDDYAQEVIQDTIAVIQDKYTIWIDDETRDDGTYDVMVYDEYAEGTDWNLSKGRIASLEQAETVIFNIIKDNPHLLFIRLPIQKR